jgi:NAD(P)-dependent dehydrogenase (short-subunit alcohol dehydrogenase family)
LETPLKGLRDKVAIVTGGANGIGFAAAAALAERGARLVILDIDETNGPRAVRALNQLGANATFVATNVGNEDQVMRALAESESRYGRIDILVNCANEFVIRGLDATPDDWRRALGVGVVGYALCAKHAVPAMRRAGGGSIVNVASISAHIAQRQFLTYSTAKGAVLAMTRCLALELAPDHIRVNSVSPGTVWTKSNEEFHARELNMDRRAVDISPDIGGLHLLHRTADPAEVGEVIAFLASESASFITAADLLVDGGYAAR